LILNSFAKLNLYLEVLNKRKDNFHNLKTVFERISLSDRIILKPLPDKKIKITCASPLVPKNKTNLCFRAAALLQKSFKVNKGVEIKIIKRIPVGAGLGGGSSNAASVFLGLNKLWKLRLSKERLVSLAKGIGSDIPFFIYNAPFAEGLERGDKIKPLKALKDLRLWHIVVVPKIKVSTPFIYKKWDEGRAKKNKKVALTMPGYDVKILNLALRKNDLSSGKRLFFNSLEKVTAEYYPEIKQIREKLTGFGLESILMSGSGPAVFGIASSRKEALSLGRKLKRQGRSWRVFAARTI
jgi:4-diphosphocytidyl-2-C-methyl-D-erythritol kinase